MQVLNVDSNSIHALPEQIGALTKLERLQAAQNALIALPGSFSRLQALKVLSLVKNKLATVPEAISNCSRLEELDLSDNYLQVPGHSSFCYRNYSCCCPRQDSIAVASKRLRRMWDSEPLRVVPWMMQGICFAHIPRADF